MLARIFWVVSRSLLGGFLGVLSSCKTAVSIFLVVDTQCSLKLSLIGDSLALLIGEY